jgi:IS5 family transposase
VTPVTTPKGGQFVLHAKALHGNPFDGHTLGPIIADHEKLTGVEPRRIHVDKGYRGHTHPNKFRVWISGQVRRVTAAIRREMKHRAACEPVIGHVKIDHRMDRNYLTGRDGDRANAILAAAGYNFRRLRRWLEELLRALFQITRLQLPTAILRLNQASSAFFTDDDCKSGGRLLSLHSRQWVGYLPISCLVSALTHPPSIRRHGKTRAWVPELLITASSRSRSNGALDTGCHIVRWFP